MKRKAPAPCLRDAAVAAPMAPFCIPVIGNAQIIYLSAMLTVAR